MRALTLLLFLPTLFFCRQTMEEGQTPVVPAPVKKPVSILALGDSYTKGESVAWKDNFPHQLADSLRIAGKEVAGTHIIAQTGWRTDNLLNAILDEDKVLTDSVFDLVTLCIGVNNQYQHAGLDAYKNEFKILLDKAIARADNRKGRVLVLSIPDWAYTPYGQNFGNPALISQEIDAFNAANRSISAQYGVEYVDVTAISRQGLAQPGLVAFDGLHPSALQYAKWVQALLPKAISALQE